MARSWIVGSVVVLFGLAGSGCGDKEAAGVDPERPGPRQMLYVGGEKNLSWYELDQTGGTLERKGALSYPDSCTFLARGKDDRFVYGLLRTIDETRRQMVEMLPLEGFVATYAVDRQTGALEEIARVSSEGDRPTYITVDRTGKFALVANNLGHLVGHSIVVFPIEADGRLGSPRQRTMTGVRAHQVRIHPNNRFVYVPNIDSDTISQFAFDDTTGQLTPLDPPTASVAATFGPRHLDFHPDGKVLFLANEYAANVSTFAVGDDGRLTPTGAAVSGVPADYSARKWQSEIRVAPSGRFVYVGERVHETIAIFSVDRPSGALTLVGHEPTLGKTPRNLALDDQGKWLVVGNQESSSLVLFKVHPDTGRLEKSAGPIDQPAPYVHMFMPLL